MKLRFLLIGLLVMFSSPVMHAQLLGTYEFRKPLDVSSITLNDTGFVKSSGHVLAHGAFLSKGYYEIIGDTLKLIGIPWHNNESYYEILSKSDSSTNIRGDSQKYDENLLILSIEVVDVDLKPTDIPIVFSKKPKKPLFSTFLDTNGRFNIYTKDKNFRLLKLGGLVSYRALIIDLDQFRGYATRLKVIMNYYDWNDYDKDPKVYFYLINNNDSSLTFIDRKGKLGDKYTYRVN